MSPEQREQALRIAATCESLAGIFDAWSPDAYIEAAALLRSLAQEPAAEPEAWLSEWDNGDKAILLDKLKEPAAHLVWQLPLYTHPAPAAERLTDAEIANARKPWMSGTQIARSTESACAKKWGVKL